MADLILTGWSDISFTGTVGKHITAKGDGTPLRTKKGDAFTLVVVESSTRIGDEFSFPVWADAESTEAQYPVGSFGAFKVGINGGRTKCLGFTEVAVTEGAVIV